MSRANRGMGWTVAAGGRRLARSGVKPCFTGSNMPPISAWSSSLPLSAADAGPAGSVSAICRGSGVQCQLRCVHLCRVGHGLAIGSQLERRSKRQRLRDVGNRPERQISPAAEHLRHEARRSTEPPRQFRPRHTAVPKRLRQQLGHVENQPFLAQQPFVRVTATSGACTDHHREPPLACLDKCSVRILAARSRRGC